MLTAAGGLVILLAWVTSSCSAAPDGGHALLQERPFQGGQLGRNPDLFALFGWLFLFTQQLQFVLGYTT